MLRKGICDIRLLRATDPRIASQMLDLSAYRAVSSMPPIRRDLSIVVRDDTTGEELGDRVRAALGDQARAIEAVEVVDETPYALLPAPARARLRLTPGQKNVLLRIALRDVSRTLTHAEANELRDAIYEAVHVGEWSRPRFAVSPSDPKVRLDFELDFRAPAEAFRLDFRAPGHREGP